MTAIAKQSEVMNSKCVHVTIIVESRSVVLTQHP